MSCSLRSQQPSACCPSLAEKVVEELEAGRRGAGKASGARAASAAAAAAAAEEEAKGVVEEAAGVVEGAPTPDHLARVVGYFVA